MKTYFKNFSKSFGLVQVLIVALIILALPVAKVMLPKLATLGIKISAANLTTFRGLLNGLIAVGFGGITLLSLANIKAKKVSFIDLLAIGTVIGTLLAGISLEVIPNIVKSVKVMGSLKPVVWVVFGLNLVILVLRSLLSKLEDGVSASCFKAYFKSLSYQYNFVVLSLVGVLLGVVAVVSGVLTADFVHKVISTSTFYGLVLGFVGVVLVLQAMINNKRTTIIDALAVVVMFAVLAIAIGYAPAIIKFRKLLVLVSCVVATVYLRALTYAGEEGNSSKIKANNYVAAVCSKVDISIPCAVAFVSVAGFYLLTFKPATFTKFIAKVSAKVEILNFLLSANFFAYLMVGLLVVGLVFAIVGLKKDEGTKADSCVALLYFLGLFAIPVFVYMAVNNTFGTVQSNNILLMVLIILAVALIAAIIILALRCKYYEEPVYVQTLEETEEEQPVEEAQTEEVVEEETQAEEETEEVVEEEVVEEQPVEEEVTEEVVEETVEEETPVEEEAVEEETEEELSDEEAMILASIPEAEETPAEEQPVEEEVTEEETEEELSDEEAMILASIPEADSNGELVEDEIPSEEELLAMQKFLDETEETAVESEEEVEETEEEEESEEETAEEEAVEEETEEVVEAKEKGIAMPEIQLVDEEGNPKKIKKTFKTRMMFAQYEAKEYYNEIKNYLVMYRAKGRFSSRCETFRYKGLVAKVALAGKSVKVCLAINPKDLEGTKYNYKDVSDKKQYIEVPTMIKVRSARGLKYFKELVDLMMAQRLVKPKRGFTPTNYLPQLIPNGEAILATIGMSTDYLYDSMNVRSVPAELPDNLDDFLPAIQGDELEGEEVVASVYLDTLCSHFEDGDEVTIEKLKSMHVVKEGNVIKLRARGTLDKKMIIYAEYFEPEALKMLMCTNCTVIKIVR